MPGSFPDLVSGGLVIRDGSVCTPQPNVLNAYCPPASFTTSCDITALPSDCTARITPAQINAIVSELVCFASTINPDGTWNCASLCNLATNFNAWWLKNEPHGDGITIDAEGGAPNTFSIIPVGVANALCANAAAREILADCLVGEICTNLEIKQALAECVISVDVGNRIVIGSDGGLIVPLGPVGAAKCTDYVQVTDVNGSDLRLIPHLPEPMQVSAQIANAVLNETIDLKLIPGVGRANGTFGIISSLQVTNPDPCRSMQINATVKRNGLTTLSSAGPEFSWVGDTLFDPGTGVLATNGLGAFAEAFPATTGIQTMRSGFFDFRYHPFLQTIPPGGTVTVRVQVLLFFETVAARNAVLAHPGNVLVAIGGTVQLFGRSL